MGFRYFIAFELAKLYSARRQGRALRLDEPVPYRRYAEHAHLRADAPGLAEYWLAAYAAPPAPLDLPADRPRPALQSYAGARARCKVPASLRSALELEIGTAHV